MGGICHENKGVYRDSYSCLMFHGYQWCFTGNLELQFKAKFDSRACASTAHFTLDKVQLRPWGIAPILRFLLYALAAEIFWSKHT